LSSPLLSVANITKTFPGGVIALDEVSMDFHPGEFTVILGENGAGKSTLVKIMYGIYTPDKGSIILKGREVEIKSSLDAIKKGIVMVSQIPQLIDRLTVVENISLSLTRIGMFETMTRVRRFFKEVGEKIGIKVNPDAKVWSLTYTQKQLIEITRAILLDAMVLILDEALTYLPMEERRKFYVYLNEFKEKGRSVILITHKIPEALEIADKIYVLRRGKLVGALDKASANIDKIRDLMFGEAAKTITYERFTKPYETPVGDIVLNIRNLVVEGDYGEIAVNNVSLGVRAGEIIGIAGVVGNGQRELLEAIVGLRRVREGRVVIDNHDVTNKGVKLTRESGVGFIPDQPLRYAVSADNNIVENVAALFSRKNFVVNWKSMRELSEKLINEYGIYPPRPEMHVKLLSGGNIMKTVVSRELEYASKALVAYNPTRGLDEATSTFVRRKMKEKAVNSKLAVLFASEDLDEVLQLSDSLYVMNRGVLYGPFDPVSTPRSKIEELMVV